jgi:hypothetical protein
MSNKPGKKKQREREVFRGGLLLPPQAPTNPPSHDQGRVRKVVHAIGQCFQRSLDALARDAKDHPFRDYIIGLGFPSLGFSTGFSMMSGPDTFWTGFWIAIGSCVAFAAIGIALSRGGNRFVQILSLSLSVIASTPIIWLAIRPAPISGTFLPLDGAYAPGQSVYGIPWMADYSGLSFTLTNDTDMTYSDVDVWMRTDILIANITISPSINSCVAKADTPFMKIMLPMMTIMSSFGKPIGPTIQADTLETHSTYYHIQCTALAPKSTVTMYLALDTLHLKRRAPGWAAFSVRYVGASRFRERFSFQCLVSKCGRPIGKFESSDHWLIKYLDRALDKAVEVGDQ